MSRYAGTSEKRELLIGDLHDVLPPPLGGTSCGRRGVRRAHSHASFPANPPTLLGLQMHPFLSTAFAFCILWIPDLGRFVVRITEYARTVSLLHCPHPTATRHPFARMPLQACRRRLRLPQRGASSVHQADWALDLCGRAAEPLRLPHNSALAREQWHRTLRASGRRLCLKYRDFGTDRRKRSSWQAVAAKVRGCALGKRRRGVRRPLRPIACPRSLA